MLCSFRYLRKTYMIHLELADWFGAPGAGFRFEAAVPPMGIISLW
jgi:hypothetical protein